MEHGEIALFGRFDFASADREFLDDGKSQPFSLNGQYRGATFDFSTRLGVFPGFELQLDLPLRLVSYTADPVILIPTDDPNGFDYYQENVIDLSQSVMGVGDIRISGRWQLFRSLIVGALELRLKTPTGYDPPAGTFGRNPKDAEDFLANVGTYVRPENVEDDVTLGDGQLDLGAAILLGSAFRTGTFVRLDLGGDLRFGGAGDRVVGNLKLGQLVGDRVLLVVGANADITVREGDVIGVSVAAIDPTLPATEYGGLNNLLLREVRLDRDIFSASAGVILKLSRSAEMTVDYSRIIHGRNVSEIQSVSVGLGYRFSALP